MADPKTQEGVKVDAQHTVNALAMQRNEAMDRLASATAHIQALAGLLNERDEEISQLKAAAESAKPKG